MMPLNLSSLPSISATFHAPRSMWPRTWRRASTQLLAHIVPAIPDLPEGVSISKEGEYDSDFTTLLQSSSRNSLPLWQTKP
jgi:hypothetical protein